MRRSLESAAEHETTKTKSQVERACYVPMGFRVKREMGNGEALGQPTRGGEFIQGVYLQQRIVVPGSGHDPSSARQDTSSDRGCRFDQKEECSVIGRVPVQHPMEDMSKTDKSIGRGPDTQRKSKSEGHCIEQAERGAIRKSPQAHMRFCPLLPTAMVFVSYGFVLVQVQVQVQVQVPLLLVICSAWQS
jgi:hypothetical protein